MRAAIAYYRGRSRTTGKNWRKITVVFVALNGLRNNYRAVATGPISTVSTGPLFPLPWLAWRRQIGPKRRRRKSVCVCVCVGRGGGANSLQWSRARARARKIWGHTPCNTLQKREVHKYYLCTTSHTRENACSASANQASFIQKLQDSIIIDRSTTSNTRPRLLWGLKKCEGHGPPDPQGSTPMQCSASARGTHTVWIFRDFQRLSVLLSER